MNEESACDADIL